MGSEDIGLSVEPNRKLAVPALNAGRWDRTGPRKIGAKQCHGCGNRSLGKASETG